MDQLYRAIGRALDGGRTVAVCTVVDTRGSTPRKTGSKMLVHADGRVTGSIGGGALEKQVIADALEVLTTRTPQLFKHDLLHQHGMCCGGSVHIFIEPVGHQPRLFIFGAGHTGRALARYGADAGFDPYVIDDRPEHMALLDDPRVQRMPLDHRAALQAVPFDDRAYIAIMTYDHAIDREVLAHCITRPFAYLGMMGSRRKVELTRRHFLAGGIATALELERVDMPIGVEIAAHTPEEIAISIVARLIQVKNTRNVSTACIPA